MSSTEGAPDGSRGLPGPGESAPLNEADGTWGTTLTAGRGRGPLLRLDVPLSFWGGTDHDGRIVDRHHPAFGRSVTGVVLAMPASRGSSSSSSVLAEQLRLGTGPAAVLLTEPDAIVALGAMVAAELYGIAVPVVLVEAADLSALSTYSSLDVDATPTGARIRPVRDD